MSNTERLTPLKKEGLKGVLNGRRSWEFDGVLDTIPGPEELQRLQEILTAIRGTSIEIKNILCDQDGTLGGAYQGVSEESREIIGQLQRSGIGVAVLTNDPNDEKRAEADELGISLYGDPAYPKPDRRAFEVPLSDLGWNPQETMFIGDTPTTDKPYLSPLKRVQDGGMLRKLLLHGLKNHSLEGDFPKPQMDFHPQRENELMVANFLVLPQAMDRFVGIEKGLRRRAFRVFINAGLEAVLRHHPGLIVSEHLKREGI